VQTIQDSKIKGVSIWFYIIAAFQVVAAYMTWSSGAGTELAQTLMVLAALDIVVGALFVVLGYFAAKKQAWAFVAGLILYAIRALLQFNVVALVIRAFLMFRIFQGLQACLEANKAEQAMKLLNQRRIVMPQMSNDSVEAVAPAPAWVPSRTPAPQSSTAE
jgi:hypothetical protein